MQTPPRRADELLFSLAAVRRALAVGGVALLAVVVSQWLGHMVRLSDDGLRLAALVTIVVGNLAMLRWFRGGRTPGVNPAFEWLRLGVCMLGLAILLIPGASAAFGLPTELDARWVLALLGVPAAWAALRIGIHSDTWDHLFRRHWAVR